MAKAVQKRVLYLNRLPLSTRWNVWLEIGLFLLIGIGAGAAFFWFATAPNSEGGDRNQPVFIA